MRNIGNKKIWLASAIVVALAYAVSVGFINPIWRALDLHIPGEPQNKVDFSLPVDTAFYVRNMQFGYQWATNLPESTWFHPGLVWMAALFPSYVPYDQRPLLISLLTSVIALVGLFWYVRLISKDVTPIYLLLWVLILPGGLGIATGNAEFPTLLFTTILLLAVIKQRNLLLICLSGGLAILTKPNAMYAVPALIVYGIAFWQCRNIKGLLRCFVGIASIGAAWLLWISYVDARVGYVGAYLDARSVATIPLTEGLFSLVYRSAEIVKFGDYGEKLKFLTAFTIPLLHMIILCFLRLRSETHRLAIFLSVLALLFTTLLLNNPNKIVVYWTTFPGFIAIGMVFLFQTIHVPQSISESLLAFFIRRLAGFMYVAFCFEIALFFVFGTPLGWYY